MTGQVEIKKKSEGSICCPSDEAHYPYGTSLRFEDELVESMGLGDKKVGDLVEIRGFAKIDSVSEYSNESSSNKSVGVQMLSVEFSDPAADRATKMYGE